MLESSLAFHYVEDFDGVVKKIYDKLNTGGNFIFSQENPINTTYSGEIPRWTRDENGFIIENMIEPIPTDDGIS